MSGNPRQRNLEKLDGLRLPVHIVRLCSWQPRSCLLLELQEFTSISISWSATLSYKSSIPSSEWVTIRRVRIRNVIEDVLWLSKTPNPKANNRQVLLPNTTRILKLIAQGGQQRGWEKRTPSGHSGTTGGFGRDYGGVIPTNLITDTNCSSNDFYHRACRKHNLPIHPTRFARKVPEFFIRLLTDENDLVFEPFAGFTRSRKITSFLSYRTSDHEIKSNAFYLFFLSIYLVVDAVGTVGKRSLLFHGFHNASVSIAVVPSPCLMFYFPVSPNWMLFRM
jgi:hypothetical protein